MGKQRLSIIPAAAVRDKRLTLTSLRVLGQLGVYTDDNGWCYPRQTEIGDALDISRETVNRAVKKLVSLGYLEVHNRIRNDGGKAANFYRVVLDPPVLPESEPVEDVENVEVEPVSGGGYVTAPSHTPCDPPVTSHVTSSVTGDVITGVTTVTTHLNDPLKESPRAWTDASVPPAPSDLRTALTRLCAEVGEASAKAWLHDLVIVSHDPPQLKAARRFTAQQVRERFGKRLEDLLGRKIKIDFDRTGARRALPNAGGART